MESFLRMILLESEGADVSSYPFSLPVIRNFTQLELDPTITFLIGENGSGKSTLIEAIAVACRLNAEGGSQNFQFATRETHSILSDYLKVVRGARRPRDAFFLRAESFYNVASAVDAYEAEASYGGVSLHGQSHGESFMSLVKHRFRGDSLYIMDEPEAALSIQRQMEFLSELRRLIEGGSQLIIATHSPVILSYPGALIYQVTESGIRSVAYEDTDQYQLTKYFLNNYQHMLGEILG